jgi:hypothetical protein
MVYLTERTQRSLTSQNDRMSVPSTETSDKVYLQYSASMPNTCDTDFFLSAEGLISYRVGRALSRVTGAGWTGAIDGAIAVVSWYSRICKSHHLKIVYSE